MSIFQLTTIILPQN